MRTRVSVALAVLNIRLDACGIGILTRRARGGLTFVALTRVARRRRSPATNHHARFPAIITRGDVDER